MATHIPDPRGVTLEYVAKHRHVLLMGHLDRAIRSAGAHPKPPQVYDYFLRNGNQRIMDLQRFDLDKLELLLDYVRGVKSDIDYVRGVKSDIYTAISRSVGFGCDRCIYRVTNSSDACIVMVEYPELSIDIPKITHLECTFLPRQSRSSTIWMFGHPCCPSDVPHVWSLGTAADLFRDLRWMHTYLDGVHSTAVEIKRAEMLSSTQRII